MRIERVHQIALAADDVEAAIRFYRDKLGMSFVASFEPPGLAFFDLDGVRLMLTKNAPKTTLYFRVGDIRGAYTELSSAGVAFVDEPHLVHADAEGTFGTAGEEKWMAFFNDPSGNLLAIVERRAAG